MVVPQKIRSEGFQWEVIALDGMKRTNAAEKWSIRLLQADLRHSNLTPESSRVAQLVIGRAGSQATALLLRPVTLLMRAGQGSRSN